jgi:hypothetical protein
MPGIVKLNEPFGVVQFPSRPSHGLNPGLPLQVQLSAR